MRIAAICVGAAGVAAAIALALVLWHPWVSANSVCDGLKEWRSAQSDFLIQTNKPDSRRGDGFATSNRVFERAATIILPEASSGDGKALRDLARNLVRVEEEWISELGVLDSYLSNASTGTSSQRTDAYQREETTRIDMNDQLRELNSKLVNQCGADPLPLYSSTS